MLWRCKRWRAGQEELGVGDVILIRMLSIGLIRTVRLSRDLKEMRELAMQIIWEEVPGKVPERAAGRTVWLEWREQKGGS